MEKYFPPEHQKTHFHCVHCGVYAAQNWRSLYWQQGNSRIVEVDKLNYCVCAHCHNWSYWYEGRMILPQAAPVPNVHADMPEECKKDYNEARDIVASSPRAASALIRLALQKLMPLLGEKGEYINDDIGSLVAKGLPVQIQQALDFCRVVGNNAVHPGELNIEDSPEIAHQLFTMMNFIVEDRISRPKQIKAFYEQLPEGARKSIEKRDGVESAGNFNDHKA